MTNAGTNAGTNTDGRAKRPLLFVVEDEPDIARLIAGTLDGFGYQCELFRRGADALRRVKAAAPALCIVDLGLPDMDGLQLVRELQERSGCAILILTGRQHVADRVMGLELGADDYMGKPFEPRELVARVRSILRRLGRAAGAEADTARPQTARFDGWTFDAARNRLTGPDGGEVALSTAETRLLETLLRGANRILSRDQLLGDSVDPLDRSIDVRISRLRRKLGEDPQNPRLIKTVYGAGYMLSAEVTWS